MFDSDTLLATFDNPTRSAILSPKGFFIRPIRQIFVPGASLYRVWTYRMRHSLERLYDAHAQSIYAFLLNFTRHEQDARDAMQEVFCKVAAKPSLLDGARDERALLLRLAHNLVIDNARRRIARERK